MRVNKLLNKQGKKSYLVELILVDAVEEEEHCLAYPYRHGAILTEYIYNVPPDPRILEKLSIT